MLLENSYQRIMSAKNLKDKTSQLPLQHGSKYELIQKLIIGGFFDTPKTTSELILEIRQTFGKKLQSNEIQTYMKKFMEASIIRAVHDKQSRGNFWILANMDKLRAERLIGKNKKVREIEYDLFSNGLLKKLGKDFNVELGDLQHNFDKSGTCTAFLLRKILEKLIYLAFAKHGLELKLEDKAQTGRLVGLESMIGIAVSEKISGIPFLTSKTAKEIRGIKFLGDAAAHNPLINVGMETIIPQMPFIIAAFEELAKKM